MLLVFEAMQANLAKYNLIYKSTRVHKFKLCIPIVGAEAPENSFSVKCCHLWNKLSHEMCMNSNIDAFKCKLKSMMFFQRYEDNYDVITFLRKAFSYCL
jgi:hypothetical protein